MEGKENEKNLDTICDRIGETVYQMQELTEEDKKVEGYLADIEQVEKIPEREKPYLYSILSALFEVDPNYQEKHHALSNLSYGILKQYERDIEEDLEELERLEEEQMRITGEVSRLKQEQDNIEEREIFCIERQKTFIASMFSILCMIGIAIGLCYWAGINYGFPYKISGIFLLLIGLFFQILMILSRNKRKHKLVAIQKRKARLLQYYENAINRFEQSLFLKTSIEDKYFVKNRQELFYRYQCYFETKTTMKTEQLKEVKKVFLHTLSEYGCRYPELFLNYPYSLVEYSERKQMKNYLETRKRQIEKHLAWQEKIQENSFSKMEEILLQYPHLREYAHRMLEPYGIPIENV